MFQVNALAGSVAPVLSVPAPLKPMTSPALKKIPSVGDRIVAVGGVPTTMVSGGDGVVLTPSETVKRTVYWPALAYVCCGLAAVDVVLSPNVHEYDSG